MENLHTKQTLNSNANRFHFIQTNIRGIFIIEPKPIFDDRGYFERYFCANDFKEIGFTKQIAQINHSKTIGKGTIRGLHYYESPFCEIKIVRCLKGAIYDVAVDLRENSPTFLHYISVELSEENNKYLYIPEGFAHGFQTLSDEAEILYLQTGIYNPKIDRGLNPLDPKIAIPWRLPVANISDKDNNVALLDENFKGIKMYEEKE